MRNLNDYSDLEILHSLRRHEYVRCAAAYELFVESSALRRWVNKKNRAGMDIPYDPTCGNGSCYLPDREEIERQCDLIQSTWTPMERARRAGCKDYHQAGYSVPEVNEPVVGPQYLVEVEW